MHARVASFEGGDQERLSQLAQERTESGAENLPEGMRRAHLLADREANRRMFVTLFDGPEAIEAAERRFEQMGDEIPEDVRGRRTSVEVYEVAIDEDPGEPEAARVSLLDGSPDQVDAGTSEAQENILPRARELPGWKGVLSLVDRESGRGKLITFWESAESMQASEQQANQLRQESAEASGGKVQGVERYEVVMNRRGQ